MNVSVIGLGKLGLPFDFFLASFKNKVFVYDKDPKIQKIIDQANSSKENPSSGITFEIGEKVKVCDGPFASFTGLVEEINEEKSRLKVYVSIFGRPTQVDLAFNDL